jgi:hypothetical protein
MSTPPPTAPTIPPIGTDAWADYMVTVLTSGGTVRPDDLAALTGVQTAQVRRVIIALAQAFNGGSGTGSGTLTKAYVDGGDAATLAAAKAADALIVTAYEAADAETLRVAKLYADSLSGGAAGGGVAQSYVDGQVSAALATALSELQAGDAATLSAAQSYTDSQIVSVGAVSQSYVDTGDANTLAAANSHTATVTSTILASANGYTDASISTAVAQAEAYTDSKQSTAGVSQAYVDGGDANTLAAAKSEAQTLDTTVLNAAETYAAAQAGSALTAAESYSDSHDATNLTAAKAYADQYAITDSGWVAVATTLSGITSYAYLRKRGTKVSMRGSFTQSPVAVSSNTLNIPVGFRPVANLIKPVSGSGAAVANIQVTTAGVLNVLAAPTASTNVLYTDGLEWFTD